MKKPFIFFATLITLSAYNVIGQETQPTSYGKVFRMTRTMSVSNFNEAIKNVEKIENVIVSGTIAQVCQAEGCWLKLKNPEGEDILVKFKDHSFTIPKDLAGRNVLVNGTATRKTISIKERIHMAEDAGASKEEIAKINGPKTEIRIESTGIIIN